MEIFTHTRCAAFAPRTHGLENMPGRSATERSIEEIDGRRADGAVRIEGNSGSDGKGEWSEMVRACVEEG